MYCAQCGKTIADRAVICVNCGAATGVGAIPVQNVAVVPKSRVAYVLLGLFLGGLGIHNFYAGHIGRAVAQLLITILIGWLIVPLIAVWIWVIVEICVVKADKHGIAFT